MKHPEKVSRYIAIIALVFSFLSLAVSSLVGWYTALKPAEIIGDFSYLVIWSSNHNNNFPDISVTPSFWLRNVGVRLVIIKDLRLILVPKDKKMYEAYPVSSVPIEAIEESSEFNEYGRLSTGSPFRGFSLTESELWTSAYKFNMSLDLLRKLVGEVKVMIQVYTEDNPVWKTVIRESLDFGAAPIHLEVMWGEVRSVPVYTSRWKLRGKN